MAGQVVSLVLFVAVFLLTVFSCQSKLQFESNGRNLINNSYIYYANIFNGTGALKCVTDSVNCCTDFDVVNWRDERGRAVHQGEDGATCLYVTRGQGVVSLNRMGDCIPDTSGLWRCDIPDSNEVVQSLYIYISNDTTSGYLRADVTMNITLHTEPSVGPPEFSITCCTEGGPATHVNWWGPNGTIHEDSDHETSQIIVDTSHNSVYENRLRVRGRESGTYYCSIINDKQDSTSSLVMGSADIAVAGEPTSLNATTFQSNSTHVNITVTWESPDMGDPVTGYVIYYQPKGGAVSSDMVSGGETETHLLDGLQRGVTYNISIVAQSRGLRSLVVGPVNVPDEKDRDSSDIDVDKILSATIMVAIFAVLLLALVSCVFCHSKRKSTTKDTQPSTSQAQNTIPHEEVVLPAPPERENNERNEVRILPTEDMECRRGAIKVIQFPDYVQRMCQEDEDNNCMLAYEFKDLQNAPTFTYNVARLSHNTKHNRFKNVYPYDNSRVILTGIPGRNGSDYINASFIQGYDGRQYIAAQGPMRETMGDFWRMIWEYKIKAIVMLTQCVLMSRERCFMYWPEARYGCITPGHNKLSVTFLSSIPYAEYEIRQLKVKNFLEPEDNSLTVTQFHYTAWPDHGVPENVMSVISFIRHVRKALPVSLDQPLLIHCSAGVGRTGTFITLDMMMQQIKAEGILSIYHCVRNLRMQRMQMVQTLRQYKFIHHALSELVVCGETEVTAFDLRTYTDALNEQPDDSGITIARKHYQILEYLSSQHIGDFTVARMEENVNKNRFPNMIPNEVYRVHLKQNNPLDSDYINASFIDGYKMKEAFIATQGPLQNTVEDFWRMMWEYQCGCIVMLCELDEDGEESSYCYWPEEVGEVRVYGWLRVRLELTNSHGDVEERKLEVTNMDDMSNSTEPLIITMLHMSGWTLNTLPHAASIITLHDQLICGQMRASSQLTTVMCSDGVTRTGTFISIHSQLERLKTEGVVDVFQAIKSARIQRPGLIPNLAHYVFCYEVLARFVETLDDYSNFENFMA